MALFPSFRYLSPLLVTLVVGLGVGWLVDHRAQVANSEQYTKVHRLGGFGRVLKKWARFSIESI